MSTCRPRRRSPPKITARWRYRLPIKNLRAHYNGFVSPFILVFARKPKNASRHVLMRPENNFVHFKHECLFLFIQSWSSSHQMNAEKGYNSNSNSTKRQKLDRVAPVDNRPPNDKWCGRDGVTIASLSSIHLVRTRPALEKTPP